MPFQTLKHHNLLSVLRLGSGQPVQRSQLLCLWGGVLEACSIIHNHHNLIFSIGRGSGQLWQVLLPVPFGSMFGITCLKRPNQHSFAICNKERFGQAFSNIKEKKYYKLRPVRLGLGEFGSACSNILHFIYGRLDRVFAARIHKVLHFRHRSVMIARSVFFQLALKH